MDDNKIYSVKNIKQINGVVLLTLIPEQETIFDFKPGQFAMIALYDENGKTWKQRPFYVCSPPTNKNYIQFAIKIFGEFTHRIAVLKEGDKVGVSGPYGFFIFDEAKMRDVVFLAGSIGVTPFVSMIRYASEKSLANKILLLYSIKTKDDIVCLGELETISRQNKNFQVVFALTSDFPDDWQHEKGRIDENMLKKYRSSFADKYFFLCGPPGFMDAMKKILTNNGVPQNFIIVENF